MWRKVCVFTILLRKEALLLIERPKIGQAPNISPLFITFSGVAFLLPSVAQFLFSICMTKLTYPNHSQLRIQNRFMV